MLGNLGNIAGLLKSAKDIQAQMAKLQESLASRRIEASSGGGLVRAVVDGRGGLVDIKIDPSAVGDVELLEDLVKAAVGAASTKAQESLRSEMAALTGGLNLPGLADMFGGAS